MSIKGTIKSFGYGIKTAANKRSTYRYPDKKLPVQKRSRGMLSLDMDNCIGCQLCYKICPSEAIRMQKINMHYKHNVRDEAPSIDFNKCIFCGLCSEICPPKVLHHTHKYDISTDNRGELVYNPLQLKKVYLDVFQPNIDEYDIIHQEKANTQQPPEQKDVVDKKSTQK